MNNEFDIGTLKKKVRILEYEQKLIQEKYDSLIETKHNFKIGMITSLVTSVIAIFLLLLGLVVQ